MRDFLVLAIIGGSLPFCFLRPHIGILMWVWIGLMNPHRLAWSLPHVFSLALIVALVTMAGLVFTKDRDKFPWTRETVLLLALLVFFTITTLFALNERSAWNEWDRTSKIYLMTLIALFLFQDRVRLRQLLYVMALSIGFYGVKGGIYSIITGGQHRIFGPKQSFIADNNALALAELLVLPLLFYLARDEKSNWIRRGVYLCTLLTLISVVFSYSRGAFLALIALLLYFLLRSERRVVYGAALCILILVMIPFIPEKWYERMESIGTYQEDASAMGRINAWWFAFNVANERPLTGGGFRVFDGRLFPIYAPDPVSVHDAHSVYFEVLGEHGYPGLLLFLALLGSSFFSVRKIEKLIREVPDLQWAANYCTMLQLSLVAYAVGGAFLGLAYFDLYYYLVAAVVMLKTIVRRELQELGAVERAETAEIPQLATAV